MHGPDRHGLDRLNSASPGAAEAALLACCGSRRWAHHLADHRPYPDLRTLLGAAERTTHALTPADLAEALADETGPHPHADAGALAALRQAQAAYEHRFGHVFLAHVDGTHPGETVTRLLAALRLRLTRAPYEEAATTLAELTRLALGRLALLASDTPCTRDHDTPRDTRHAPGAPPGDSTSHNGPITRNRRTDGLYRTSRAPEKP
ncbi:OHCU decarboxylase [Streptomyces eurocidicus]|nr:OHCU decarboxylase [Streptomyces eurocidicus]